MPRHKCHVKLDAIIPNNCILLSIHNHSLPFINDFPPKTSRLHHLTVDNNNILPSSRVIDSEKSRKIIIIKYLYISLKQSHVGNQKLKFFTDLPNILHDTLVIFRDPLSQHVTLLIPNPTNPLPYTINNSVRILKQK